MIEDQMVETTAEEYRKEREVEELREALEYILEAAKTAGGWELSMFDALVEIKETARKALEWEPSL